MPEAKVDQFNMSNPRTEAPGVSESRADTAGGGSASNTNLLSTAQATQWGSGAGFAAGSGFTVALSASAGPSGAFAGGATRLTSDTTYPVAGYSTDYILAPNTVYTFSIWIREPTTGSSNGGAYINIKDRDAGSNLVAFQQISGLSGTWARYSWTFNSGPTGYAVEINYYIETAGVASSLEFWGAKLEAAATATGTTAQLAPGQP
jgi:hypothetical protein